VKRILISQRVDIIESYRERRDALDQKWAELLWQSGCTGLPVPNHLQTLTELVKSLSIEGILLTGGNTPVDYGGSAPERDIIDNFLISYSVDNNIPLLGICRGMQSIVLYFGGTLRKIEGHVAARHFINISRNVNSYHEYAPDMLPDELEILAQAGENEIEYIKHKKLPIFGIMWHPERESPFAPEDIELIQNVYLRRTI
jgi:putative glutamine amidotransferase